MLLKGDHEKRCYKSISLIYFYVVQYNGESGEICESHTGWENRQTSEVRDDVWLKTKDRHGGENRV